MSYRNINNFIKILEENNELIRVKTFVSTELEMTEIVDRIVKANGKAILFENNGSNFPVLMNAFGSEKRICLAFGIKNMDDLGKEIQSIFKQLTKPDKTLFDKIKMLPLLGNISSYMPKVKKYKGICQEVIIKDPDLSILPILKCWPFDGGRFITLPLVHTKDIETGIRNVGMYRMQVFDNKSTGMHWHKHKDAAMQYLHYKKLNKLMPIAVALGGDPVYTYVATAPLPENIDEYILAGFIRKKSVNLVKCVTQDIEVPEDADIIIEGYVDPNEDLAWEGPFGDHTGYYSLADWYPKFHVTCITHRKEAIYPATIVGIPPQEDAYLGKATERIFLEPIKLSVVPEIIDMQMPYEGVFHNLVIVKIKKTYVGQAIKVMHALWGAGQMMFNKILIVVDEDFVLEESYASLQKALLEIDINTDIHFSAGPLDVLDHSSNRKAYGSKLGIDLTRKIEEEICKQEIINKEVNVNIEEIRKIKGICEVNTGLLQNNVSVLFVSVVKQNKEDFDNTINLLIEKCLNVKFIFILEENMLINDYSILIWKICNNIDPLRDCKIVKSINGSQMIIDATHKTKNIDGFERDWPNITMMDEDTIKKVDEKWNDLGIGEFIHSPSLKFKKIHYGNDAIVK